MTTSICVAQAQKMSIRSVEIGKSLHRANTLLILHLVVCDSPEPSPAHPLIELTSEPMPRRNSREFLVLGPAQIATIFPHEHGREGKCRFEEGLQHEWFAGEMSNN